MIDPKIIKLLRKPPSPIGNFRNSQLIDGLVYVSGQGPFDDNGNLIIGKIGKEFNTDEGNQIARKVGLTILSVLHEGYGLENIDRVIKLTGYVNCIDGFKEQPRVINGCSDLMVECFGENGIHARSAVGIYILPNNIPVEIEGIFKLK